MRKKVLKLIITFEDTTQAMHFESICNEKNIKERLIPLPGEVSAGCGLAWKAEIEQEEEIKEFIFQNKIKVQGFYKVYLLERCNDNE